MKSFFEQLEQSIWSPSFYASIPNQARSVSWKYYWVLSFSLAVVMTIMTSLPLIPDLNRALDRIPNAVREYYPDELIIRADAGKITTNVVEPYYLSIPVQWQKAMESEVPAKHLAVIDTATPISLEKFREYQSMVWIGKDTIVSMGSRGEVRMEPIPADTNFVLDEAQVDRGIVAIEPFFVAAAPILVIMICCAFLFRFAFNLLYLLFAAVLVLAVGMLLKRSWSYGTAYRISLHAVTLPLLLEQIFLLLPISGFHLPFFTTFVLLLVVVLNFTAKEPVSADPAPTSTATH